MKNHDKGLGQLLDLLKKHPELLRELVLDTESLRNLLSTKAARQLTLGPEPTDFLQYMAGSADGSPIAQCLLGTTVLCAKGTGVGIKCGSRTQY